jgi:hypothetical protein
MQNSFIFLPIDRHSKLISCAVILLLAAVMITFSAVSPRFESSKQYLPFLLSGSSNQWKSGTLDIGLPDLAKAAVHTAVDSLSLATRR